MTIPPDVNFGIEFFNRIVDWIADNLSPDGVFEEEILRDWAESNGYEPIREDY